MTRSAPALVIIIGATVVISDWRVQLGVHGLVALRMITRYQQTKWLAQNAVDPWRITTLSLDTLSNSKLAALAYRQGRVAALLRRLEDIKKELRGELFQYADDSYEGKEYLRPTTTISVPMSFLAKTNMSTDEFIASRFPAWEQVGDITATKEMAIIVLRKKLDYMPWEYEDEDVSVSRSISESTPDIDWDAMEKVDPALLMKIGEPVIKYELNEQALQELVANDPAVVERLKLYTVSKKPVQRVLAKIKNDGRKKGA